MKLPTLEQAYSNSYSPEDKKAALKKLIHQIEAHFPTILDSERDRAAAEIHIASIQKHLDRTKLDVQNIMNSLQILLKIGEKKQDDMLACALLDYIDEIMEILDKTE